MGILKMIYAYIWVPVAYGEEEWWPWADSGFGGLLWIELSLLGSCQAQGAMGSRY